MKVRIPLKDVKLIQSYYKNVDIDKLHILEENSTLLDSDTLKDLSKYLNQLSFNGKLYTDLSCLYLVHNNTVLYVSMEDVDSFIYTFEDFLNKFLNNLKSNKLLYKKTLHKYIHCYSGLSNDLSENIATSFCNEKFFETNIVLKKSVINVVFTNKDLKFYFGAAKDTASVNNYFQQFSMSNSIDKNIVKSANFKNFRSMIIHYLSLKGFHLSKDDDIKGYLDLLLITQY